MPVAATNQSSTQMQPDAGNRFSLVAKISLNMICIIILRSAQMYATLFALPNFIVGFSCNGAGGGRG